MARPKLTSIQVGPKHSPYEAAAARSHLAQQLRELPDAFVACRDLQHAWDTATGFYMEDYVYAGVEQQRVVRRMTCVRCGTERTDRFKIVDNGLVKTRSDYRYAEGYQFPASEKFPPGTKPLSVVRAESLRRSLGVDITPVASRRKRRGRGA